MNNLTFSQAAVKKADLAYQNFHAAMLAFQANLMRNDQRGQEEERERALDSMGEYLDQMMLAHKGLR